MDLQKEDNKDLADNSREETLVVETQIAKKLLLFGFAVCVVVQNNRETCTVSTPTDLQHK